MRGASRHWPELVMELARDLSREPYTEIARMKVSKKPQFKLTIPITNWLIMKNLKPSSETSRVQYLHTGTFLYSADTEQSVQGAIH